MRRQLMELMDWWGLEWNAASHLKFCIEGFEVMAENLLLNDKALQNSVARTAQFLWDQKYCSFWLHIWSGGDGPELEYEACVRGCMLARCQQLGLQKQEHFFLLLQKQEKPHFVVFASSYSAVYVCIHICICVYTYIQIYINTYYRKTGIIQNNKTVKFQNNWLFCS